MILRGSSHHRRSTDVDLLDDLVAGRIAPHHRLLEWVQVRDHELERCDLLGGEVVLVILLCEIRQDPAMDPGMQRLDSPSEDLGGSSHVGDGGDGEAGGVDGRGGPT